MGGILIANKDSDENRPFRYAILTATKLTSRYVWFDSHLQWNSDKRQYDLSVITNEHPLQYLELSQEDIQDKSKADYFVKSLAILQIAWLVLNVVVRTGAGLPVTQLEIATVAFAVMAILTYLANWWKPKDISEPTKIYPPDAVGNWLGFSGLFVSLPSVTRLSYWFLSPDGAHDEVTIEDHQSEFRIPNDLIWMRAEGFSMILLLAISSLLFGGLHCIAWNFDFPSRAELIAWRIGCAITAGWPVTVLAANSVLGHRLINHLSSRPYNILMEELDKLPTMSEDWWHRVFYPCFLDWNDAAFESHEVSVAAGRQTWSQIFSEKSKKPLPDQAIFKPPWEELTLFRERYISLREIWNDSLPYDNFNARKMSKFQWAFRRIAESWEDLRPNVREFWGQYEMFVSGSSPDHNLESNDSFYTGRLLQAFKTVEVEIEKARRLYYMTSRFVSFLPVMSYIVYPVARLLLMVLLFTSLRSLPADAYEVTPWVNFLPKIS